MSTNTCMQMQVKKKSSFLKEINDVLPEKFPINLCLTCGACSSGCPASGKFDMDPRKFVRMVVLGFDEEVKETPWVWVCTMCKRCMHVCPMNIDIPALIYKTRASWPREERPRGIRQSCDLAVERESGSSMGTSNEDFSFVIEDVLEEVRETQPRFRDLKAPIDKKSAEIFVAVNSRNPVVEPDEMVPLWKIFHTVGADWTYSSKYWAGENYCMFLADDDAWEKIVKEKVKTIEELGCKIWVNDECGHELYAMMHGLKKFNIPHSFEIKPLVSLYAKWIREGKLPVSSDWNKDLKIKFTVHDPCNLVRKGFGEQVAEDLRFVVKKVVGEENFVEMYPNGVNNYCCGGGGGALQAPYNDERRKFGRIKFDQIMATGANYCIAPCHNCHSQLIDLNEYYSGSYYTIHIWTIICLSIGILGDNEREYLGPNLKNVGL